ncbi:MAG: histidine kinase [Lachnospiraceae bacterium]|nr:histidine kinase [Lachnospiraceae bacterium]
MLRQYWLRCSIHKKLAVFISVMSIIIVLAIAFDILVVKILVNDFGQIWENNSRALAFVNAVKDENEAFHEYMKYQNEATNTALIHAMEETKVSVNGLELSYEDVGNREYAQIWSIKNIYDTYCTKRDIMMQMTDDNVTYVPTLYEVYEILGYLSEYGDRLLDYTIEDSNEKYHRIVPTMILIPVVVIIINVVLMLILLYLANVLAQTLIAPIYQLSNAARKIADNEKVEKIVIENQDEMGDLVQVFNEMKDATEEKFLAMEEARIAQVKLHSEAMERLELEKRLENAKLELLTNQINPHFLFNTLNVIAGMANLEDAKDTEMMTRALSAIFRYNLKNAGATVLLRQELKIVMDYMYLQQMRFSDRVKYSWDCRVNADEVVIPSHILQPLVENSVIHGITAKEDGGKVKLRVYRRGDDLRIHIIDSGVGMSKTEVENLRNSLQQEEESGIGLGNVYKRLKAIYHRECLFLASKKGMGTIVTLEIPWEKLKEQECTKS